MKRRVKIRQHVLVPAIVEHEVEFDDEQGRCTYVGDGIVVSSDRVVSRDDLERATPAPDRDRGAAELAFKALVEKGVLHPSPGEPIVMHGHQIPYVPEDWDDLDETGTARPGLVPLPERPIGWRMTRPTRPRSVFWSHAGTKVEHAFLREASVGTKSLCGQVRLPSETQTYGVFSRCGACVCWTNENGSVASEQVDSLPSGPSRTNGERPEPG